MPRFRHNGITNATSVTRGGKPHSAGNDQPVEAKQTQFDLAIMIVISVMIADAKATTVWSPGVAHPMLIPESSNVIARFNTVAASTVRIPAGVDRRLQSFARAPYPH